VDTLPGWKLNILSTSSLAGELKKAEENQSLADFHESKK